MNWIHEKGIKEFKEVSDFPEGAIGFIYELHFSNGRKYIGRKSLYHTTKKKISDREKKQTGTRKKFKFVTKEDKKWQKYEGSIKNEQYQKDISENNVMLMKKVILEICYDKWDLTYHETRYQFDRDCLRDYCYYNGNILGKFYRKKQKL